MGCILRQPAPIPSHITQEQLLAIVTVPWVAPLLFGDRILYGDGDIKGVVNDLLHLMF